ncbi:hypothetical protein GCM10011575_20000 [Microlunatus endophyticus]|uniref:Aminoglycoside phosphotransferase domain-containing protein n=1 Tax=Microlunatus endophyticus TaxID=1716077 RepID=A0A917S7J0_9ACTN|nr:phosphotransferase [Microlunatus endophyticus]GGL61443.1 hypothetical protein GCM10011575_20000 [Microlunatus endophyticus]
MTDDRLIVTDDLVDRIAARFGIGSLRRWSVLSSSWTTNLRLDADDRILVARLHQRWTNRDRLAAIQHVRRCARSAGLPTVTPIPAPDAATMISLPEGTLVELESYVDWDRAMKTPDLLEAGFAELGRLHDLLRSLEPAIAASRAPRANHVPSARAAALTRLGADRIRGWNDPVLDKLADQVVDHIEAVTAAERSWVADQVSQLVHGDFWDNNVLFAGDELAAVIDFDFMAERWRIDDLALPIWFYLLEPGHDLPDDEDRDVVRRLLDAYDSGTERPLSHGERLALPLAVARQPAWSVGRWVLQLEEEDARAHASSSVDELPIARTIMTDLSSWQAALAPR